MSTTTPQCECAELQEYCSYCLERRADEVRAFTTGARMARQAMREARGTYWAQPTYMGDLGQIG